MSFLKTFLDRIVEVVLAGYEFLMALDVFCQIIYQKDYIILHPYTVKCFLLNKFSISKESNLFKKQTGTSPSLNC